MTSGIIYSIEQICNKGDVKMKFKSRIANTLGNIQNSYKRFPGTIGVSVLLVIMLITLSELGGSISEETRFILERIIAVIALGIPLSLCITLIFDKKKDYNRIYEVGANLIGLVFFSLLLFFYTKRIKYSRNI